MTTERGRRKRPGRGRHWAPCAAGGARVPDIMRQTGLSMQQVRLALRAVGARPGADKCYTAEQVARALAARAGGRPRRAASGERVPDIMRRTGLTREQVRVALRAAGARPGADKGYAAADVERALGAFRRGAGKRRYRACPPGEERLSEAAARIGAAETTVQRVLRAAGMEPRGGCYSIADVDRAVERQREYRALVRQRARLSLGKRVTRREVGAEMGSSLQEDWAQERALAELEGRQIDRQEFIDRYVPYNERLRFFMDYDYGRYRGKRDKKQNLE